MTLDTHVDQISIFEKFGIQFYIFHVLALHHTNLLKHDAAV